MTPEPRVAVVLNREPEEAGVDEEQVEQQQAAGAQHETRFGADWLEHCFDLAEIYSSADLCTHRRRLLLECLNPRPVFKP